MSSGRLLLCTDLDRTLIPNGPQPESPAARPLFNALVERPDIWLTYVSGRDRGLVQDAIEAYRLPSPEFVIADVGSSIYRNDKLNGWRLDDIWETGMAADWRDCGPAELANLLTDLKALRLQESAKQNRYKLSYYVPVGANQEELADGILERLQSNGIRARLIWSLDTLANVLLLDVVPAQASKYHAIDALMRMHEFTCENTVFCGDSGNDLDVFASPVPAVVVANATADVRQTARTEARKAGNASQLYLAHGEFLGMNGNYSAGMLEGIAHYQPQLFDWMSDKIMRLGKGSAEGCDGR